MDEEFLAEMHTALQRRLALVEIVEVLRAFRDRGMSAETAEHLLESLLVGADDDLDERIREVGDIICGFCSPHMRVWPSEPPPETAS